MSPASVLQFWFADLSPKDWFRKSEELDRRIAVEFGGLHQSAAMGELWAWRDTPEGALAEIIVLDQFSRNIHRHDARAFACDGIALTCAQEALRRGYDRNMSLPKKSFMYMPFMHSESKSIHEVAVKLFSVPGLESNLDYELKHKEIIDRFGRYPHRNGILGRESTPEEIEFIRSHPGF